MIGPLISADDVCDAVEDTLVTWLPSVSAEIAAAKNVSLPAVTSYSMPDPQALRSGSAELPALVVSSPGLASPPQRDGEGMYRAAWTVVVSVFARGVDYRDTARVVRGYALAVRTSLLQHPSLGDFASELVWVNEEYDALDPAAARTAGGAFITVQVVVDDVTDAYGGPLIAPQAPASLITNAGPTATDTSLSTSRLT